MFKNLFLPSSKTVIHIHIVDTLKYRFFEVDIKYSPNTLMTDVFSEKTIATKIREEKDSIILYDERIKQARIIYKHKISEYTVKNVTDFKDRYMIILEKANIRPGKLEKYIPDDKFNVFPSSRQEFRRDNFKDALSLANSIKKDYEKLIPVYIDGYLESK